MTKTRLAIAVMAALAAAGAGVTAAAPAPEAKPRAKPSRLSSFDSCRGFVSYAKRHALPLAGPGGFGPWANEEFVAGGGAARAKPAKGAVQNRTHSTTNVQEEGVDEPDIVKTDGLYIYSVARGRLQAVRTHGGTPDFIDWLDLENGWSHDLLLRGDRLLVLSRGSDVEPSPGESGWLDEPLGRTVLTEVDVGDPTKLRVVRRLTFEGGYVDARMVRGTVRVVLVSFAPHGLRFTYPRSDDEAEIEAARNHNRTAIATSRARHWLPRYTLSRGRRGRTKAARVQCRQVRRAPAFSGFGLMTVLTIDLDKGLVPTDVDAIFTEPSVVYASEKSLYVATERWEEPELDEEPSEREELTTEVHKFDAEHPTQTRYRASGRVRGYLLNQWALSERDDVLRVASTLGTERWATEKSRSRMSTFREEHGKLVRIGWLGNLGRGERIYAVRYVDSHAFLVTFEEVDPLYVLDLSRPTSPRLLGELKIPGYSAYLHPIAEDVLLGVGQDVRDRRMVGTQLSVFDVSERRRPVRLHKHTVDLGWSEVEEDHHAFLYWAPAQLVVLPIETWSDERSFSGALAFRMSTRGGIAEVGRITHAVKRTKSRWDENGSVRRSLVIDDVLYTVSAAGIRGTRIDSLEQAGWTRFK